MADLQVTDDTIRVWLQDGRTFTIPLAWYPRLCDGSVEERNKWETNRHRTDAHWPDLDEDITVGGLMTGPTSEGPVTLGRWLLAGRQGRGIRDYEIVEWERSRQADPLR